MILRLSQFIVFSAAMFNGSHVIANDIEIYGDDIYHLINDYCWREKNKIVCDYVSIAVHLTDIIEPDVDALVDALKEQVNEDCYNDQGYTADTERY